MLRKNIISIFLALVILWLSMANQHTFDKVSFKTIPNFDKLVHFMMYFGLMSVILFENRAFIKGLRQMFLLSVIPIVYGIIIEFMQAFLTTTRSGSFGDAMCDIFGVAASLLLANWLLPRIKEIFK